jgi:hypothetical protein
VVRAAPAAPPPPIPQKTEDETYDIADDDLAGLNSLIPSDEQMAEAQRELPPVVAEQAAAASASAQPLEYHRDVPPSSVARKFRESRIDPETGEFSDPMRDYIAPAVILGLGLVGIAAYMMQITGKSGPLMGLAISIAFIFMLGITLFKTMILIFVAFPLASYCDVSVGLLRTAVLKLAATVLFGDVAIMWFVVSLQSAGLLGHHDNGGLGMLIIYAVLLALIYQVCFWYMFRIAPGDAKFAALMSFISRLADFFLLLVAAGLVMSYAANHAQPTASPYIPAIRQAPSIPANAPMTASQGQPTAMDDLISQEIHQNPFRFQEGYAWCRMGGASDADKKLISDLYQAGADKVMVEGFTVYAQLPGDKAKRAACLDVAHAFRKEHNMPDGPDAESLNYQYCVINMLGTRLERTH